MSWLVARLVPRIIGQSAKIRSRRCHKLRPPISILTKSIHKNDSVEPNEHSCGCHAAACSAASVASIRHVLSDNQKLELRNSTVWSSVIYRRSCQRARMTKLQLAVPERWSPRRSRAAWQPLHNPPPCTASTEQESRRHETSRFAMEKRLVETGSSQNPFVFECRIRTTGPRFFRP